MKRKTIGAQFRTMVALVLPEQFHHRFARGKGARAADTPIRTVTLNQPVAPAFVLTIAAQNGIGPCYLS